MLETGATFTLTIDDIEGDEKKVSISYEGLVEDIDRGNTILIDDGLIGLEGCEQEGERHRVRGDQRRRAGREKGSQCPERGGPSSCDHREG